MSLEAAAGKNPVSHVGKIYNLLAHEAAAKIVAAVPGVEEATVWLCSQIGRPIDDPWSAVVELSPKSDAALDDISPAARRVMEGTLRNTPDFLHRVELGEFGVC